MTEIVSKKRKIVAAVPNPVRKSIVVAEKLAGGVEAKGVEVGIKFATGKQIRTAASQLSKAEETYQGVLASRSLTLAPAFKVAEAESRTFIIGSKKVLSFPLGESWNQGWAEAGFLNAHLKSPKTTVDRIAALQSLSLYFASHPEHEGKAQGITAEQAGKLHLALSKAHRDLDLYDTRRKDARAARDKARKALRKMATDVIVEIRRRLPADSTLWETFGLNAPKPRAPRPKKEKAPKSRGALKATAPAAAETTVSLAS